MGKIYFTFSLFYYFNNSDFSQMDCTWTKKSILIESPPFNVGDAATIVVDNVLYVIGGFEVIFVIHIGFTVFTHPIT